MPKFDNKKPREILDFTTLRGVWRSRGYGTLLEIGTETYTLHEETSVSCLPVFEGSLDELAEHYLDIEVSPNKRAFSARPAGGVARLNFRRMKRLPSRCRENDPEDRFDPEFNFEVFWHTFAERYAFFELKDLNWKAVYKKYRPKVNANTGPRRLFEIFMEMLRPMQDGHVRLHTTCGHFDAGAPAPLHDRLVAELDRADDAREVMTYLAELREGLRDTIREEYLRSNARRSRSHHLEWGLLSESMGYLNIRSMAGFSGHLGRPRRDLEAVDDAMEAVMEDLGDLAALVVDLRFNGGGFDPVALRLAGYLTDRKRLAFTKTARQGSRYTGKQRISVEPRGDNRFAGELILLTSGLTASAAEVFVLALLQHPRLTLVGEATHGILSDAMERHLPNGWFMTLSNEVYRAYDHAHYEDCGIPPHIPIPFLDKMSREEGRDPMLDYVLEMSRSFDGDP